MTERQEKFLAELTTEQRQKYKEAFSNQATSAVCAKTEDTLEEHPVVMMLLKAANSGPLIGTCINLASDTNYITNEAADRLGLHGEAIKRIVHGIGRMKTVITKRYSLRLKVKTPKIKWQNTKFFVMGWGTLQRGLKQFSPKQLQKFFPNVFSDELIHPTKIGLLIRQGREGCLVPQPTKVVGDLVLWDGPLGKTIGGTHPDIFEAVDLAVLQSDTHLARSMRTASMVYKENITAQAEERNALTRSTATTNIEVLDWFI